MRLPAQSVEEDAVSPLELFFDLVFVFAVSQLSHHLLEHLTWRGAAETLVMLIAVFGVSQTYYLWAVIGTRSLPRLAGIAALVLAGGLAHLLPPYGALGLLTTLLLVIVVIVVREWDATSSRLLTHRQA